MYLRFKAITAASFVLALSIPAIAQSDLPNWIDQGDDWASQKANLQAAGEQFDTAWDLYQALAKQAGEPTKLEWSQMGDPAYDWSGIWTRTKGGLSYDPEVPADDATVNTAKLTEAGKANVASKVEHMATTGGEVDAELSFCGPATFPRLLTEPFLHEWVVTPSQTWLMWEQQQETVRVYTDGRDHVSEDAAFPVPDGDTIGFWASDTLVTHTNNLVAGNYQRGIMPAYSEQVEAVMRWHKVDDRTLEADVWIYDADNLAEPWYTRQSWTKLTNEDNKDLRLNYWNCTENQNNNIVTTDQGTSQFGDFDFVGDDAAISTDPAVAAAKAKAAAANTAPDTGDAPAPAAQ